MSDKREFTVIKEGTTYSLPMYKISDQGLELVNQKSNLVTFVRGSKDVHDNIERQDGVLHETIIAMLIHDLQYKNELVPSRETSLAITQLQTALFWLEERARIRTNNNTLNTYEQ